MKNRILTSVLLMAITTASFAQTWPVSLAGRWTFDNPSDLLEATTGSALIISGTHTPSTGFATGDGAATIGIGSYYRCNHGMTANGGGSLINEYSIMWDVMIANPRVYHSLFQTNTGNTNDGDGFISPNGQIGLATTGYSGFSLRARLWYRIVLTVDNGSSFRYYVNGKQVLEGSSQGIDGQFGLDPAVLFFADENGEDNPVTVSQLAIFNTCLSAAEVRGLGGFRVSDIQPYLQSPNPASVYISWYGFATSGTAVDYGTTTSLGASITGTYEDVGSVRWHTVKLTGLNADTRYYYRCRTNSDTSLVFHFRTPPAPGAASGHIRFIKLGDSQDDAIASTRITDTICHLLQTLYGSEWRDSINLVMHSGDITQDGNDNGRFMNEYINPMAKLSSSVPFMISIGNHEGESNYHYKYMKYEDLTGNNERYYTFNLGNCQFVALNTNGVYNNVLQTTWLQTQLNRSASDPNIDFVFEFNHQPGHSEIWPDGNTAYVYNDILPVLASYPKVVLNTTGHSHNFERGTIRGTHSSNWDFRSILCGGAGGPLDRWGMYSNQTNYPEIQKSLDLYSFLLFDVNIGTQTLRCRTYSLGNTDRPRNIELVDEWHRYLNQPAPQKPDAMVPASQSGSNPVLVASTFAGTDSVMSSQFQIAPISGSFAAPLTDMVRDFEDFYGDSGSPLFNAVNLNQGIDLRRFQPVSALTHGQTYMWRMRYRDRNLRWSDWSDTLQFTVNNSLPEDADFTADVTIGNAPLTVHFTDLSTTVPFTWEWDMDGDGTTDASAQDPVFTYTTPGVYTVSMTAQIGAQLLVETKTQYIEVTATGMENHDGSNQISIFPSPADDFVTISSQDKITEICIWSMSGLLLKHSICSGTNGQRIYTGDLAAGCYIVEVNRTLRRVLMVK